MTDDERKLAEQAGRTWTVEEYRALNLPRFELLGGKIFGSDAEARRVIAILQAQVGAPAGN